MTTSSTDYSDNISLFHQIVTDSQSGVVVFEAVYNSEGQFVDFQFAFINPAGAAILGKPAEQLIGQRYLAYFSQAENSGLFGLYRQVLESGKPVHLSEVGYQADGLDGWFDLWISRFGNAVVVTYTDVTSIKQTKLALETQAFQLRTTLDASISSIFYMTAIRNEQNRIVDFLMVMSNKAVLRSNNMTPEQVEGKQLLKVFPGNADNGFFDLYVRVTESGEPESSISYYRDDIGLEGWFEVSAVKQDDGVVVTFMNITDQKKAESELQQKNEALVQSNQNLQSFAYIASHDLQAPLRKIRTFSDVLLHQYNSGLQPEAQDILHRINLAATRMSSMVQDLLTYSRLTTQPPEHHTVSLSSILSDVVGDLDPAIQETGASIRLDSLPELAGDPVELGQLFQNLLSNALKFRRPGIPPRVRITCLGVAAADLPESVKPSSSVSRFYRISVSDNGIGFKATDTKRIFQMFQRLHNKNEYEGTGIGLAICQKVVENHGGAIRATSQPDQGAVFDVYLPA
ncbi:ATP-binding protein [Larkinella insperata]|uniref:histidine kinase n=1 Tax=Larkinella insperata TaxID=332158 RepID=A0ABW3Q520_9BACT|nr:PAS domain-containing sensor histidine kinase [Larkinella insperata]